MNMDEHIPHTSEHHLDVQNGFLKSKKKKCRGNRKLQRFRRKCRAKGMNDQAIEMLMWIKKANRSVHQNNQQIHEEQMDSSFTTNMESNNINMSMISENQNGTNECRDSKENLIVDSTIQSSILLQPIVTKEWCSVPTVTYPKSNKRYNLSNDHWNQVSKLIPNYKKLSPYQFKDVLTKVIPPCHHHHIKKWITNFLILQFIQQRAELMCTVLQLKIEHDYWNYIANLMMTPTMIWLSKISKDLIKQNSINWDHTKTKINIQHRQNIVENKLQQAQYNLNLHLQQPYSFYWQIQNNNSTSMDHFMNIISNALVILVDNNLYYFRTNFEQKKILLQFDINDIHLVKLFYDLNPTQEQISIVQQIWRDKVKSCKRAIRQKKKNHSSIMMNHQIKSDETIDIYDQQHQLLSMDSFTPSMYTIIEDRLRNIEQRAQQLMKFINTIDDDNNLF